MSQFCVISFRFCTGAPKYLVARNGVLVDWTFDLSKAAQYEGMLDADTHYLWVVECLKGGNTTAKVYPEVLAPLHNNQFSLIELAIDRVVLGPKKTEHIALRRVHIDLLSITRKAFHVLPDKNHATRTPANVTPHQPRREIPRAELPRSVPWKRSVGV